MEEKILMFVIIIIIRTDQYVAMEEEEFKLSDDDIKWLLCHTEYDDKELNTMLAGEKKHPMFKKAVTIAHVGKLMATIYITSCTFWERP